MKTKIIIISITLVVSSITYMVFQHQMKMNSIDSFNTITSDIKKLQSQLLENVKNDEILLATTNKANINDPKLLDKLSNEINTTKRILVDIPDIAIDSILLNQQIQDLITKKYELQNQLNILNTTTSTVTDSKENYIIDSVAPKDSYSIIATDGNGNKEKITIEIGKWIKGSDEDLLNKTWKKIGGTESIRLDGSYSRKSQMLVNGNFTSKNSAYIFGTVLVENLTPDFDAKDFARGDSQVSLNLNLPFDGMLTGWRDAGYEFGADTIQCLQLTSGTNCEAIGGGNQLVHPNMTSNTWGPVPFAIILQNAFTPKFPKGNPKIDTIRFFLSSNIFSKVEGDKSFQVKKSW